MAVTTWLYTVEQYLSLIQLSSSSIFITDQNKISFASSYLTGNAAIWWYQLVNASNIPSTWDEFRAVLMTEFIPADHKRRARDKLRRLKQTSSVEKYLSEYPNSTLQIGDMNEGEKVDRFVEGLKFNVRVEVLKTNSNSFEECARIALNVDSAIWRAKGGPSIFHHNSFDKRGPTAMEIGNINGVPPSKAQREQRKKDLEDGACFRCHKAGCRPWKCRERRVNNIDIQSGDSEKEKDTVYLSDSENE